MPEAEGRIEITPTGEAVKVPLPLDGRCPRVSYLLGAYLVGDDRLEFEIGEFVATEGAEWARLTLDELRLLVADPTVTDDELDTFVTATTPWLVRTGRTTLARVADRLAEAIDQA